MSICQPVIGIDDRKPNMGFHMDHMTSMYFTDRSVNYNSKFNMSVLFNDQRQASFTAGSEVNI